jgi:hypothetical protein
VALAARPGIRYIGHRAAWFPARFHTRTSTVDELIQLVAQRAGITPAQAELAIVCMLGYLTARLPSPVVGRIREQLGNTKDIQ